MMRIELAEPGIQIFHGLANMVYGAGSIWRRLKPAMPASTCITFLSPATACS